MTYHKQTTIFCDGCSEWERFQTNRVATARKKVREEGWKANSQTDLCPDCRGESDG